MDPAQRLRDQPLTGLLVCPNRQLAQEVTAAFHDGRIFQILADLKFYPARHTLEIKLRQLRPDIVFIDVASNTQTAEDLIQCATNGTPATQVIAINSTNESNCVVAALRSGASEFLYAPFVAASQREAAARIRRLQQPQADLTRKEGKIILFSAAKPGSGSTTLAAQTAISLQQTSGEPVLLADLNLEAGDISLHLQAEPETPGDQILRSRSLDLSAWNSMVADCSGVTLLAAPNEPTEPLDQSRLEELLGYVRLLYPWVILDAPVIFHRTALLSMAQCDQAYLISTADLASLHMTKRAVDLLDQLGFPRDRYQVIMNRLAGREGLARTDLEKLFRCPVPARVPDNHAVLHALLRGRNLPEDSEFARSIQALAQLLSRESIVGQSGAAPGQAAHNLGSGDRLEKKL